ncbi:inactive protein RESTRICTED TEV MOVEMENT 1 [Ricinus communis]|uniref:Jacalin-type lectin domain-containing protein n=1 Tax=Ricinus communis TaxID=3988 RepID=B9RMG5_RICCO|nr:inactive protein RESTRICTED TEV MOVEMENT 1 [Ricinus communis]EEF47488.1 conserved hypothetical protein [Ricinus communis]|eukprot:XP_002514934.1 inactive protein RESTRICTED TEV MOVEMENT 1 [Ricinus communis]
MIKVQAAGVTATPGEAWDWNEPGEFDISQIFISHDGNYIRSIQFEYVQGGNFLLSPCHGTRHGPKFLCVKFDYPAEFLKKLSGKYDGTYGNGIVSLTFTTNKKTYGPFGNCEDHRMVDFEEFDASEDYRFPDFDFDVGENRFGGFHGFVGRDTLLSIGIYVNLAAARRTRALSVQGSNSLSLYDDVKEES